MTIRNEMAKNEQEVRTNLNSLIAEGVITEEQKKIILEQFIKIEKEWKKFSDEVVENFNKLNDDIELENILYFVLKTKNEMDTNILKTYIKMEIEKSQVGEFYIVDGFNYHSAADAVVKILYNLVKDKYNNIGGAYSAQDVKKYQETLGLTGLEIFQLLFNSTKAEAMDLKFMTCNFDVPYDYELNKYKTTYVIMTWIKYFNIEDLPVLKRHKRLHELLMSMAFNKEQAEEIGLQIAEL